MTTSLKQKTLSVLRFLRLPWLAVYAVLIFGSAAFASSVYQQYDERHLPSGYIELAVGKTRYEVGETVTFSVTNHFPTPVFVVSECPEEPLDVFRWENEVWVQIHDTARDDDSECYEEERNIEIPPEGSRDYDFDEWPELFARPGVYRIASAIDHYSDVPFQDFVVMEPLVVIPAPAPVQQEVVPAAAALIPVVEELIEYYEYDDDEEYEDDEWEDDEDRDEHEDEDEEDDDD